MWNKIDLWGIKVQSALHLLVVVILTFIGRLSLGVISVNFQENEMPGALSPLFENQEELKAPISAVTITGTIPAWIHGTYLRVGPGMFDVGKVKLNHFTDGYSMLSKFDIKDGQVTMHKKFLRSEAYKKAIEQKEPFFPEFATKGNIGSQKSFFSRLISAYSSVDVTDNDSLNVFLIGNDIFASTETMHITRVEPKDLQTSEKVDYTKVFGSHMATPHALVDSQGDWYNIGTSFSASGAKYQVMKIPHYPKGGYKEGLKKATVLATISPSNFGYVTYYHTFGMTESYIIFVEQPWTVGQIQIIDSKLKGKSIRDLFSWDPKGVNRFHVVNKKDGKVYTTKFQSEEPFFFFHFANCFEEGETLVADILTFPDSTIIDEMEVSSICERRVDESAKSFARINRFAIPLVKNVKDVTVGENLITLDYTKASALRTPDDKIILKAEAIGESGIESPGINPNFRCARHRFIYGSGLHSRSFFENSLCKVNVETGETKVWKDNDLIFPGDPKFIPREQGTKNKEDDGILVAACADMSEGGKDFLLFLNAETMAEEGRAIFNKKQIPQSIHSIFLPSN